MTLLETVLALSLMSIISLAAVLGVRVSWQAWSIQDQRSDTFQHLNGLLTHVTRHLRSTRSVGAVSAAADTSGYITITLPDDSVVKWDHDDATSQVLYGVAPPTDLLAMGIDSLKFECFEIDGVTPTIVPADIRMIRATATITLPVQGTAFSLSSTVWIRKQQDALAPEFIDFYARQVKNSPGWTSPAESLDAPDGVFSEGDVWAETTPYGCDTTGYSGSVGTVVLGLYLKTDTSMDADFMDVAIRLTDSGTPGPTHSFSSHALLRYVNNLDWFWIDVTDDLGPLTYEDVSELYFEISNREAGVGGATIFLDSVAVRTFEAAPLTQTYWMTSSGTATNEWLNPMGALGPPDGTYAQSTFEPATDRQSFSHPEPWEDLGTIVRVRLLMDFYVTATFVDDEFKMRLRSTAGAGVYLQIVPISTLNQHIGLGNQGTLSEDFSNQESWTWPSINSREVRLQAKGSGGSDGDIYVDAVALKVRYVPPTEAAVVLWEEL